MNNIGILTDSTCDLPDHIIKENNIHVIPLTVHFKEEIYKDGEDISTTDFFDKLEKANELPTTSQASVGLVLDKYKELKKNYDQLLSIHLSSKLSGTYEAAQLAASQTNNFDIRVVDSKTTTLGLGFLILKAARLIKENKDINYIEKKIKDTRANIDVFFTVDDLSYLQKGGRIGKAQAFLGTVLNFNPILELNTRDAEVLPREKVRGTKKTRKKMISIVLDKLQGEKTAQLGIVHGKIETEASNFKTQLENNIGKKYPELDYQSYFTHISPILGCHTGPRVYGVIIMKGYNFKI